MEKDAIFAMAGGLRELTFHKKELLSDGKVCMYCLRVCL